MTKILYSARTAEIISVGDSVVQLYNEQEGSLSNDRFLAAIIPKIEQLTQDMTAAYNRDKIKSELVEADELRSDALSSLSSLIDAHAIIPLEEKQAAAKTVKAVLDKHGKAIVSLLNALFSNLLLVSIDLLDGVKDKIESLRTAQKAFDELYVSYTTAMSNAASATSYRKSLLAEVNEKLVTYLSAMVQVFPEEYGQFAENVEQSIVQVNGAVQTRSKNGAETATTE